MPKSMFESQIFRTGSFSPLGLGAVRLAQASVGLGQANSVSQETRDKMIPRLNDAADKLQAWNNWIAAHPNTTADLGADAQTYSQIEQALKAGKLSESSATLTQALANPDPAVWAQVSAVDWNNTETWINAMNQIYVIIQRHQGPSPVPARALVAVPQPASGITPVVIGIGALAALGLAVMVFK